MQEYRRTQLPLPQAAALIGVALLLTTGCGDSPQPEASGARSALAAFTNDYSDRRFDDACTRVAKSASVILGSNTGDGGDESFEKAVAGGCPAILRLLYDQRPTLPPRLAAGSQSPTVESAKDESVVLNAAGRRWTLSRAKSDWQLSSLQPLVPRPSATGP